MLPNRHRKRNTLLPAQGHLKLFTTDQLEFSDRLVFSWLAFRDRHGHSSSISEIAFATTLHRDAVAASLKRLLVLGLVEGHARSWRAKQPPESMFCSIKAERNNHWSDELAYVRQFFPAAGARVNGRRFSIHHTAVYSLLISLKKQGRRTSKNGLAKMLGFSRRTIYQLLSDLTAAKLVRLESTGRWFSILVGKQTPEKVALFRLPGQDDGDEAAETQETEKAKNENRQPGNPNALAWCQRHGIPDKLARQIAHMASGVDEKQFLVAAETKLREHSRNNASGKYAKHCGFLIRSWLNETFAEQEKVLQCRNETFAAPREPTEDERAAKRKLELEIAADPMHPKRLDDYFREHDIINRVAVSLNDADDLLRKVTRHVSDDRNNTGVWREALKAVNHFYGTKEKASCDELKRAINAALKNNGFDSLFEFKDEPPPQQIASEPFTNSCGLAPDELASLMEDGLLTTTPTQLVLT